MRSIYLSKVAIITANRRTISHTMAQYLKNFVTGYGIAFENSKRNLEAREKSLVLWREIASKTEINDRSIVMLCGAKNNGKSSLMRYLVNDYITQQRLELKADDCSLETMDEIEDTQVDIGPLKDIYAYYVDFDPGQCEMTSGGVVSAHIIRATAPPLRSPTYLNVSQHEALVISSVGGLNMAVNPRMYMVNCRYVFNTVIEHRHSQKVKRPIFINTMGHVRNVGLAMLTDLIKSCRPTDLIVLNVEADPLRTIFADLSPKCVDDTIANFYYETKLQSTKQLDYKCDIYKLPFTFVDSTSIATKNRTALQLAYMASIPEAMYKPIMQLTTKWISFQNISIFCVSSYPLKEAIVLDLLLHSWVHLVQIKRPNIDKQYTDKNKQENGQSREDNTEALDGCDQQFVYFRMLDEVNANVLYGCGIVAQIDLEKRMLALITPVEQEILDTKVDCIIKPLSIQVPAEMIQHGLYS